MTSNGNCSKRSMIALDSNRSDEREIGDKDEKEVLVVPMARPSIYL